MKFHTFKRALQAYRDKHTSKRGDAMLLWVVLAVIVVMAFQGHVNILNQTSTVNEFQHQMDVAGLNALNKTIDINRLQQEEELFGPFTEEEFLSNYSRDIRRAFREELYTNIPTNSQIANVEVMNTHLSFLRINDGNLGSEHIMLDGVVRITMNTFGMYNPHDTDELLREFEMGRGGSTKVTHIRRNQEGQVQLFLHNQTRLQY